MSYVKEVTLTNFRNHKKLNAFLSEEINFIVGPNGSGKTSVIEGIYFALLGRSFRSNTVTHLIQKGIDFTRAEVWLEPNRKQLAATLERNGKKTFAIDGLESELTQTQTLRPKVVVFFPQRVEIVYGPPTVRRGHLDQFSAALIPTHTGVKASYIKSLTQRNALLARGGFSPNQASLLDAWESELAKHGHFLVENRKKVLQLAADLVPSIAEAMQLNRSIELRYKSSMSAEDIDGMARELKENRGSDLARGFTTKGPHRDDFYIKQNGSDLRSYGSQGERRIALLTLLLAEAKVFTERTEERPLLLLDDVTSELDSERACALLKQAVKVGQTVVTATDLAVDIDLPTHLIPLPQEPG